METMKLAAVVAVTVLGASAMACGGASAPRAAEAPAGSPAATPAIQAEPGADTGSAAPSAPAPAAEREERSSKADTSRPGLGTEWGETRFSRISTVPFVRADSDSPFAAASLFYNDAAGARAMSSQTGSRRVNSGEFAIAGGVATIGLRDGSGQFLTSFVAGEKDYVVGEAGSRYTIVLRNRTDTRFEVVVSVDGLDVLDGKSASFRKRGYLLDPRAELEIDGFRQSTEAVAAFRFGSVRDSYASQKHGETRNVGVIGVALFNERGSNPRMRDEVKKRLDANPFPGQFATPPN